MQKNKIHADLKEGAIRVLDVVSRTLNINGLDVDWEDPPLKATCRRPCCFSGSTSDLGPLARLLWKISKGLKPMGQLSREIFENSSRVLLHPREKRML